MPECFIREPCCYRSTDRRSTEHFKQQLHRRSAATSDFTMRFSTPFFLLILSGLCLALAHVSFEDCCLKYVKKLSHKTQKHAVEYRRQTADGGCNLHAVIFTMKRGRQFCADPREHWVNNLMTRIDERVARNGEARANKKIYPHIVN